MARIDSPSGPAGSPPITPAAVKAHLEKHFPQHIHAVRVFYVPYASRWDVKVRLSCNRTHRFPLTDLHTKKILQAIYLLHELGWTDNFDEEDWLADPRFPPREEKHRLVELGSSRLAFCTVRYDEAGRADVPYVDWYMQSGPSLDDLKEKISGYRREIQKSPFNARDMRGKGIDEIRRDINWSLRDSWDHREVRVTREKPGLLINRDPSYQVGLVSLVGDGHAETGRDFKHPFAAGSVDHLVNAIVKLERALREPVLVGHF